MQAHDLDWRIITNGWSREELLYVRAIIDEKLSQLDSINIRRKSIIYGK